jgi:predicted lipoprotein with Yx(FWY)xxD motif
MKRLIALLAVAAATAAAVVIATTGGGSGSAGAATAKSSPKPAAVAVHSTKLGRVLVDGQGRTLYLFESDRPMTSTCAGACASVWPPVTTAGHARARTGISGAKLATIRGGQVTYAGHPLYLYAGDQKPGDVNGQGLNQFGAKWYVLAPSGRKVDDD